MTVPADTALRHIRKPMGVLGFDKTDVRSSMTTTTIIIIIIIRYKLYKRRSL
jgi:hypothetical protein